MINLARVSKLVNSSILKLYGISVDSVIEVSSNDSHGDFTTNIALAISKAISKNPIEVAKEIVKTIDDSVFEKIEIAGPGFINFTLSLSDWHKALENIINKENLFPDIGKGRAVQVEFVSVNPTGPLHIGHARGAVYGDVLSNILEKTGFKVLKEYYINDAGKQIDTLAESLYLRCRELHGDKIEIPDHCYPGGYLVDIAKSFMDKNPDMDFAKNNAKERFNEELKSYAVSEVMNLIKRDLAQLGICFDSFISEKNDILPTLDAVIEKLIDKGLIYKGVLEAPKGIENHDDWEHSEQLLFRSSKFGDDLDRPVLRSDGTPTYFAGDIAYHDHKIMRGFDKLFLILGRDHIGYIKRIESVVNAISNGTVPIIIKAMELVKIKDGDNNIKMSKRSGNFITVAEIIDLIGKDALRFSILTKRNDTGLDIDISKLQEQSKNNPLFYIQYAHARACSVLRKAKFDLSSVLHLAEIVLDEEVKLIKKLACFETLIIDIINTNSLHKITYYLEELALLFHQLWTKGNKDEDARFIDLENEHKTAARLALVFAFSKVLKTGLKLLEIDALESM
ncbi:Arginine--tRNA ligase [Candidatus Cyrtobacter comes]|uniref:Arginine--tRNA ligase n=1 Tax=Candidatus Cyrtobacter comes TaxID=675776 RepID=A0ABU5L789_9RICK|nr:arginine--tRNA ligase [Candidatus Cyrtobacter comes]MDZ5761991.1 Arginine--tRNA ligase [Candidatus Cyrtobacter comes]